MNFRIQSPTTRPLHGNRPSPRKTAPLQHPQADRQTRRLAPEEGPRQPTGDLTASADFRALQARGALTHEVLAQLRTLATQPLAKGIDRRTLLATVLRELADPERIGQGDRHTCAAAVVQAKLAQDNPAEYLRLVAGLASPSGEVTLANGEVLRRHSDWRPGASGSIACDLMQPAFMQYATGSYDLATDTRATFGGRGKGLYAAEQSRLVAAVSGVERETVFGNGPSVLDAMRRALETGHSVPVVIQIRDRDTGQLQGHSVLVERIRDGQVTFLDPSGKRRSVSLEAFTSRLQSASLPADLVPAALARASEGQEGVLAGNPFFDFIANGAKAIGQAVDDHVVKPVVQATTAAVRAVDEHVIQPVAGVIGQAGAFVQEKIVQPVRENLLDPVARYIGPVASWLSTNVFQPLYVHVLEPLAVNVIWPAWEFVRQNAKALIEEIKRHQDTLKTIAMVACLVTPGLNALALVLVVGDAIDGAKDLLDGLKEGNWRKALGGTAKLLGAVAAGIGGPILSKVVGSGATALARVASGIGKLAAAGEALADVCDQKASSAQRFGRLLGMVALVVGGTSSVIGEHAEKAAEGFTTLANKANGYYDASVKAYDALLKGEANWKESLSLGLGLAANLQSDIRNDAGGRRLRHQVSEGVHVLNEGTKVWEAMTHAGPADKPVSDVEAIAGFLTLGSRVSHDVTTDWNPDAGQPTNDKAKTDPTGHMAELWRDSKGLTQGDPLAQVQAAWAYFKKAGTTQSDDQLTQWLRHWTSDLERWGEGRGQAAKEWANGQISDAWRWWTEQRQAAAP